MTGKKYTWKFTPEVVNGVCPTCEEDTLLVSITREYYRCVTCGTDLEQHVNGKIVYLPTLAGKTLINLTIVKVVHNSIDIYHIKSYKLKLYRRNNYE